MRHALIVTTSKSKCQDYSTMFSSNSKWSITCVGSFTEAVELIYDVNPDTVFMDLENPIPSLNKFVTVLRENFPTVNRLILRSPIFSIAHRQILDSVHSSFLPPKSGKELNYFLNQVEKFFPIIAATNERKVAPKKTATSNVREIYRETISKDGSLDNLYELIEEDKSLLSKVMKRVNSSYYTLSQRVEIPARAIRMLGMDGVRELVEENYPSVVETVLAAA